MAFGFFKKKDATDASVPSPGSQPGGAPDAAPGDGEAGEAVQVQADAAKARRFFERAQTVDDTGNHEYAMTLWLQGLRMDPTSVEGLEKFVRSGTAFANSAAKPKGPTRDQATAFSGKGPLERYLQALLYWGMRPLDWAMGLKAFDAAAKLSVNEPAYWIGTRVLGVAGQDSKARKNDFVQMMNLFSRVNGFDKAVIAGEIACKLDPTDAPLITQVRNMSAQATMTKGGYEKTGQAGGFRENVKDLKAQRAREEEERLVKTEDVAARAIDRAKVDYEGRPTDPAALQKYAKLLIERGSPEDEKTAYQLLMKGFEASQNYRFKQMAGEVRLRVGRRKLRELKAELEKEPENEARREAYSKAEKQVIEAELKEYEERVAAYPTDMPLRFELAKRFLDAGEPEKAIEHFQQARSAPAILTPVLQGLGVAFWRLGWLDEAESTFREAISGHASTTDDAATELKYGLMEVLERKGTENQELPAAEEAFKLASAIAVQRINFKDIRAKRQGLQELVKTLRGSK